MKKRKIYKLKFKSIQSTMTISFSLLILLAVFLFVMISSFFARNAVYENSVDYMQQIIDQVNYDIDAYIEYMENISALVAGSEDVQKYLFEEEQAAEDEAVERKEILNQFHTIFESREDIYNIAAIGNNGKCIINDGKEGVTDYIDISSLSWYQAALSADSGVALSSSHVQNAIKSSYQWVITLSRALVNHKTGNREGVFFVDLNYSAISELCNNNSNGNKGYIFIIDENGSVIYHPKQDLIYGGLLTERIEEIQDCNSDYLVIGEGSETKLYTMSKSSRTGWTVVGVADTENLMENIHELQMIYIVTAILFLGVVIILSSRLSREITRPIRELKDTMSLVQKGHFEKVDTSLFVQNEVGSLGSSFNIMIDRIQELICQNIIEQEEKRKSELMMLWAQMKPHFLYNTLDSIIWMAEAGKNDQVVIMTSALAKLLRQSIGNDKEEVTIEEELIYVDSYLTIQKMRYNDKLEYTIDIDPEVKKEYIVKFTIQPLVENAIYHGLKYKDNKGNIDIQGFIEENDLYITVTDDGVGMDEETLEHIFEEKDREGSAHTGIGIGNVQKRLQMYYGMNYGITYFSEKGCGTTATIVIPQNRRKAGEDDEE